ncbi:MAG: sodium:solute symporter [Dysgonamonadaceae bacterium]|jgi:Na+/proline symporter|nr:sodium:solute symporter [Dysgonamonadaceae bacterium]
MNGTVILLIILLYFGILWSISYFVGKKHSGNAAFFLGNRQSPWYIVAIGMIGSSLSGVTFVSVPGWAGSTDMTYMQMVFGFVLGYAVIAFVLLPIYYKLQLTSIYTYLQNRIGKNAYKTGAGFFLLSRTVGASVRLYVAVWILQTYVFEAWGVPFVVTAAGFLLMIWLYTHKSGVRAIVWTDLLQTLCLLTALVIIIWQVAKGLNLDFSGIVSTIRHSEHTQMFVFDDWHTKQNFFKQFISGCFVTIAMTGIDQEMMQKNISCKNLKAAQKNVCTYSLFFIPVNFLFLCLGILLLNYYSAHSLALPLTAKGALDGDALLPTLIANNVLGLSATIFFTVGIIAVTFASADSALTGLTTSVCVDLLSISQYSEKRAKKIRLSVHWIISVVFIGIMLLFRLINSTSVIDAIYMIASYTYGPLLGLFAFGILFKRKTDDRYVPFICLLSPVICFLLNFFLMRTVRYTMGYELLLLNATLVLTGLLIVSENPSNFVAGRHKRI